MENLTGGTPPVRYLPCVVPCKLYFLQHYIHTQMRETLYPLFRWLLYPIVYSGMTAIGVCLEHLLAHESTEEYIVIHLAMY